MRVSILLKSICAWCALLSLCFALFPKIGHAGFSAEQVQVIKEATEEFAAFQKNNFDLFNQLQIETEITPSPPTSEAPKKRRPFRVKRPEPTPLVALPKKYSRIPRWRKVLTADEQAWIESLFGKRPRLKVVKFRDFSSIWKKLNDSKENYFYSLKPVNRRTTGSHRPLYDYKGNVVVGIFAHGDSQEYGLEYQIYLAKAFADIGVIPER